LATSYGILAIFMWGTLALLGANTVHIPAFQLLFLCFSISAVLMFVKRIILKNKVFEKPKLNSAQWLVGVSGLFGFHFCYFMALKKAPAIEVSLIAYFWPMLLGLLLSSRDQLLKSIIGSIVGFIGITFIIVGDAGFSFNQEYVQGYGLAFLCALMWAFYSWFQSRSNNSADDIGWLSIAVALLSLIAHFVFESTQWQFSQNQWIAIILLGAGPVGGAFYLWDIGLKNGNKRLLASLSFCTPLISAIILSFAGLNSWSINILISLTLILLGALISNMKSKVNTSAKNQISTI